MQLRSFQVKQDNWLITVSPHEGNWIFHCLPPNSEALTNHVAYTSAGDAISAAKRFVDKAIARVSLGEWIDRLLEEKRITPQEWKIALYLMQRLKAD